MTHRRRAWLAILCTGLLATTAVPQEAIAPDTLRRAFMDAMTAVDAVPTPPPADDGDALRGYVLYPYLQAARLQRQLQAATPATMQVTSAPLPIDGDIAAFVAAQADAPVTRRLRDAWLASLAARRSWATYLGHFSPDRDTSPVLRCHALAARVALERTDGLLTDLTAAWLTPKSLPDACDPALAWWKARGGPGEELVVRRARLALEAGDAGLARYLTRSLPPGPAAPLRQWVALIEEPAAGIPALVAAPDRPVEPEALLAGWERYARADAERAATTYPALVASRKLDARAASPYALAVALALSWGRLPGALEFFARVHVDDFDERAHEWHARAALWVGDWKRVATAIAAMPDALRSQARWQYWAARASERLGEVAQARAGYAAVVPTDNWYAALAAARLDRKLVPNLLPLSLDASAIAELGAQPAFQRARELLLCRMEPEANAEWRAAVDALQPARQTLAVGLASQWGWHHQAIASAAKQRIFNDYDLLYPRPYDFEVREASRRTGLRKEFIYAIIRQESLYRADAGSSAGALGLMQLLPDTARMTARRSGLPTPTRAQLLQPAVNIPLGSAYLAGLVDRFDGEMALATAAYNAGPNAARRWLPPAPLDLDVWAENIPYNETRAYVQRVAWHALVFDWLDTREPRDVSGLLRSVKPAPLAASNAD
jgi:soluble lytic murein transglycosylase